MKSVSGSFLEFIDPLLEVMGYPDPGTRGFDSALKLGWLIWNTVIQSDVDGDEKHLREMRRLVPKEFLALVDPMIERKRKGFADCLYLIGHYELRKKPDGSMSLFAEARESTAVRVQ